MGLDPTLVVSRRGSRWGARGCRPGADDETDALNKFTPTDMPRRGGSPVAPGGGWAGSTSGYPDDITTRRSCGRSFKTVLRGLIDEGRLGGRRSFFARVFSFSESLPRSATVQVFGR